VPPDLPEPNRPFRWNLAAGDRVGSLLEGVDEPDLWFADELLACAAKVLARCADGDLHFVGRSVDSLYDLLSGALAGTSWAGRLRPLPFSTGYEPPGEPEVRQLRANLAAEGLAPELLARRRRPVVLVDLVYGGRTFDALFSHLRRWIAEERAQWDVIRLKLRFLGLTERTHTSPNTWRWQQHAPWTTELPASAVANVSLDWDLWRHLGNEQAKVTRSFRPSSWLDTSVAAPPRDTEARHALAEALALVEWGRRRETRAALVRLLAAEPGFAEPWLRSLALELRR